MESKAGGDKFECDRPKFEFAFFQAPPSSFLITYQIINKKICGKKREYKVPNRHLMVGIRLGLRVLVRVKGRFMEGFIVPIRRHLFDDFNKYYYTLNMLLLHAVL